MSTSELSRPADLLARLRRLAQGEHAVPPGELAAAVAELQGALERQGTAAEVLPRPAADEAARQTWDQLQSYRGLFQGAPDAILVTDLAGGIREANLAAAALLGTRPEFLAGKPLGFLVAPPDRQAFFTHLVRLQRLQDTSQSWDTLLQARNQAAPLPAAVSVSVVYGANGTPELLYWLLR